MALDMFKNPLLGACFILIVIFTPTSIVATVLRFVASRSSSGKVGKEDWAALGALLVFLGFIGCVSKIGLELNGRGMGELPLEQEIECLKYTYAANVMFPIQQTFAKFSILFLYDRLFGVDRRYAGWIRVIGLVQLIYLVTTVITSVLICRPVQKYWEPQMTTGHCINIAAFLAGVEVTNSGVDFAMMALAVMMVRNLQVKTVTKFKLSLVFMMGGTAGLIGFVKIGLSFKIVIDNQIVLGVWALVQMAMSILCCCVIVYRPFFSKNSVFSRLASRLAVHSSWSRLIPKTSHSKSKDESTGWKGLRKVDGGSERNPNGITGLPLDSLCQSSGDYLITPDIADETLLVNKTTEIHQRVEKV